MLPQTANVDHGNPAKTVGAIVVAAGRGERMGGVDKVLSPLIGRPLIAHSLAVLNDCPRVEAIVLVMAARSVDLGRRLAEENGWQKVVDVCAGGERRQDSVRIGLDRLPDTEWTIVHDGARPCIDEEMVARGLAEARRCGAAVAGVPVKDTIKAVGQDGVVEETLDRSNLWVIQTPQVFRTELLSRAHGLVADDVTDDASMVELIGNPVSLFTGSHENLKVTTPEDLPIAEAILKARDGGRVDTS